jgi:hypothetical protein
MDSKDLAIKSLVCDACWNGIFSADGWQTVLAAKQVPGRIRSPKGFSYKTTWAAIQTAANSCNWCRFLARQNSAGEVEVWAACDGDSDCTPAGEKWLEVVVRGNGFSSSHYYMYTSPGTFLGRALHRRYTANNGFNG